MAKKTTKKSSSKKPSSKAKKVEITQLGGPRVFGTNVPLVPTAEKGQIAEIRVELGKKSMTIYQKGDFVRGMHPTQAQFILNSVIGGTGSARGARQLGFASWVAEHTSKFKALGFSGGIEDYNVVVDFSKRGGTMVYSLSDLIGMCVTKAKAARNSFERFPREDMPSPTRTRQPVEAEVSLSL